MSYNCHHDVLEVFLYNSADCLDEESWKSIRSVDSSVRDLSDNLRQSMVTSSEYPIDLRHHRYTNLRELAVGNHVIDNLDFLEKMCRSKLTRFILARPWTPSETAITNISALAACTKLEHLDLSRTNVDDISVLAACTNLRHLDLSRTGVADISAVAACTNLRHLDLSHTRVSDISALAACTKLDHLRLSRTRVVDISALAACTHLQHLNLRNTRVSDISAVAACTNLRYLNLSHTRIPTCKEEAA